MKVFNVATDIENIQLLLPTETSSDAYHDLEFDGSGKFESWTQFTFYIDNPWAASTDFYSLMNSGVVVCNETAAEKLGKFWSYAAELLPINVENGQRLYIVNIIDRVNALNHSKTDFFYYDDGIRSNRIKNYSFHKNRFHESSIFKIPESAKTQILTYSGIKSSHDEFMTAYLDSGLTGLIFEEIYSDEIENAD